MKRAASAAWTVGLKSGSGDISIWRGCRTKLNSDSKQVLQRGQEPVQEG